jgi:1,2-diacylglycerol 3-beta-glucosyltransferase
VPAYDEQTVIAACVRSLLAQTYPRDRYEVVVVADNCTDDTAAVARAGGAKVLRRDEPAARGKGRALRWALDRLLAGPDPPDAVAVVDADSLAEPDFLARVVRPLERGALAVQGTAVLTPTGSPRTALRAAAVLLVNHVRPAGRAVLGGPCHLAGNGMLLSRRLLVANPWCAYTSAEDLEYTLALRSRGIGPVFAGGAVVRQPAAPHARAAAAQQLRWEGGKLHLARTWIPRLVATAVRERRLGPLDAAYELAVPPLGLLTALAALGTAGGAALAWRRVMPVWGLLPWAAALAAVPVYVLAGLRAARAPASAYRALAGAPLLVLATLWRLPRTLAFRGDTWVRTERPGEVREDGRAG